MNKKVLDEVKRVADEVTKRDAKLAAAKKKEEEAKAKLDSLAEDSDFEAFISAKKTYENAKEYYAFAERQQRQIVGKIPEVVGVLKSENNDLSDALKKELVKLVRSILESVEETAEKQKKNETVAKDYCDLLGDNRSYSKIGTNVHFDPSTAGLCRACEVYLNANKL